MNQINKINQTNRMFIELLVLRCYNAARCYPNSRMIPTVPQSKPIPETHLQRTLTSVINELPVDAALAAVFHRDQGPLVSHAARGFTPRDIQAILRTLSASVIAPSAPRTIRRGGAPSASD